MPKTIDHDLAHRLADIACMNGDSELALELLQRATRNGRTGSLSSLRTMNRVLNLKERLKPIDLPEVTIVLTSPVEAAHAHLDNDPRFGDLSPDLQAKTKAAVAGLLQD